MATTEPNQAPTADFTWTNTDLTADFTDTSTDSDGSIVSRDWDFGDGSAHSTATNPSHTYDYPGSYTVTLTVSDRAVPSESTVLMNVTSLPVSVTLAPKTTGPL